MSLLQAGIIAHKKEAAAQALRAARDEYSQVAQEVEHKRQVVSSAEGGEVLKGEDVSVCISYSYSVLFYLPFLCVCICVRWGCRLRKTIKLPLKTF